MCDHQHRADVHELFERVLNEDFCFGIDVCGCFVEDHNGGLVCHRSRKGEELTLTCGEVVAAFADFFIKTVFELCDKVIGVHVTADGHDFFIRNAFVSKNDVASDRTREEEYVLEHLSEMTAQGRDLDLTDINAVNEDLSLLDIVISADEGKDRCFARSCGADKRNGLLCVYMEGNVLQYPFARNIREPHVLEFDLAADLVKLDSIRFIHDNGVDIEDREDLFRGSECGLQTVELLRKALDRVEEFGDIHIERDENMRVDMLSKEGNVIDISLTAEPEETEDGGIEDQIHHRAEDTENEDLLLFCLAECDVSLIEISHFFVLAVEDLNDLHAGKIFGKERIDIGRSVFYLAVCAARKLTENKRKENDKGNEAKHHQRQHIVEDEHRNEDAEDDKEVFDEVDQNIGKHHGNGGGVVRNTGYELTDGHFVKLRMGERFDMAEGIFADGGDDLLSCFLQDDRLQIHRTQGNEQDGCVKTDFDEDIAHFKLACDGFFDIRNDERGNEVVGNRKEHQKADNDEIADIGLCIAKETACDLAILHVAVKADGLLFVLHGDEGDKEYRGEKTEDAADHKNRIVIRHVLRLLPRVFGD